MELTQAVVLALIQGITEFLPISSTAHLVLVPLLTGWPDQGLAFDVALNTATWLAVVIYFRREIKGLVAGLLKTMRQGSLYASREGELAWMVLVATVPVAAAGFLARDVIGSEMRSMTVIAWSSIVWGVFLWLADRTRGRIRIEGMGWATAIFVGLFQAVALIPGTSRSGITMMAGLFMGLDRTAAARFSFLLAIVVGALAGGKEGLDMVRAGMDTPWAAVIVGGAVAFVSAYLTIHYFLKAITRFSMAPFAAYRIILGAVLLLLFL